MEFLALTGSTDGMQLKVFMCLFVKFFFIHQTNFHFYVLMIVLIQMVNGLRVKLFGRKLKYKKKETIRLQIVKLSS